MAVMAGRVGADPRAAVTRFFALTGAGRAVRGRGATLRRARSTGRRLARSGAPIAAATGFGEPFSLLSRQRYSKLPLDTPAAERAPPDIPRLRDVGRSPAAGGNRRGEAGASM